MGVGGLPSFSCPFSVSAGHFSPLETHNGKGWVVEGEAESDGAGNDISSLVFFPPSLASLDVTSGPVERREVESTFNLSSILSTQRRNGL